MHMHRPFDTNPSQNKVMGDTDALIEALRDAGHVVCGVASGVLEKVEQKLDTSGMRCCPPGWCGAKKRQFEMSSPGPSCCTVMCAVCCAIRDR